MTLGGSRAWWVDAREAGKRAERRRQGRHGGNSAGCGGGMVGSGASFRREEGIEGGTRRDREESSQRDAVLG